KFPLTGVRYDEAANRLVIAYFCSRRFDANRNLGRRRGFARARRPWQRLVAIHMKIAEDLPFPRAWAVSELHCEQIVVVDLRERCRGRQRLTGCFLILSAAVDWAIQGASSRPHTGRLRLLR